MRVWVDGSPLTGRITGIQRYTESLLRTTTAIMPELDMRVFTFQGSAPVRADLGAPWRTVPFTRLQMFYLERLHVRPPLELWLRTRPSIFFFSEFSTCPVSPLSRCVVVIYDLVHLDAREFVADSMAWWLRHQVPRAITRADVVITISHAIADDIRRRWPRHASKVRVVTCGVDDRFRSVSDEDVRRMREVLGLPGPYLAFAATLEPRKNLTGVLDAYAALPAEARAKMPLVAAGGGGWKDSELRTRLERAMAENGVRTLGYVKDELLPAFYAGARAFVFPSHYEGFGLPVLEAMAAGTAVVASTARAVKEVAGDAALLVDSRDTAGLTAALGRVIDDDALCEQLSRRGRERAARFTWHAAAEELRDILRTLAVGALHG